MSSNALPTMQASKWLTLPTLVDISEMQSLLQELGSFHIFCTSLLVQEGEEEMSRSTFLETYKNYIELLKQGKVPSDNEFRTAFSTVFSADKDHVTIIDINGKKIVRVIKPIIQLQSHRIHLSSVDGKFHSKAFGPDNILWGIQFSYPQLFKQTQESEVENALDSSNFPNAILFQKMQKWVRYNTMPTPFLINGQVMNVPFRLGKQCCAWINQHPQLIAKGIKIGNPKSLQ